LYYLIELLHFLSAIYFDVEIFDHVFDLSLYLTPVLFPKSLYARSLHVDSQPHTPSLTSSYVHGTSSISLLPLTVGQSLDSTVQRWPDREAVVFMQDGIRKTFAQFQQDVRPLLCHLVHVNTRKFPVSIMKHVKSLLNSWYLCFLCSLFRLIELMFELFTPTEITQNTQWASLKLILLCQ